MKKLSEIFGLNKPQRTSVKVDFERFLNSNNCHSESRVDDRNNTCYHFDYQGGHFVADIKSNNRGVDITFPGIADADIEDLHLVRALCNHYNSSNSLIKFIYTTNEEDNRIAVHLSLFANTVWPDELHECLSAFFFFQREFCDHFRKAKQSGQDNDTADSELDAFKLQREQHMIRQQVINHQIDSPSGWNFDATDQNIQTNEILELMLGLKNVQISCLVRQTSADNSFTSEQVFDHNLRSILLVDGDDGLKAITTPVTLSIEMTIGEAADKRYATMLIIPDASSQTTSFFRITAMLVPEVSSQFSSINSNQQLPLSNTVTIAINHQDTSKLKQEFDYMWKDAQLKRRDGEQLNELQQLVVDVTDANIGFCMYWGRSFMLDGRFYEAIRLLENAFNALRTHYFDLSKELRNAFFEICYYIGFCYSELHLFRDAYYYLDYLRDDGNIRHTSELINAMANGKDFRLFALTDDIAKAIQQQNEHDEDIPEGLKDFVNFMRRRRAYAMIDHHQLDEAEKAFTAMLDDPDNSDYALGELAYIKRLRENNSTNDNP